MTATAPGARPEKPGARRARAAARPAPKPPAPPRAVPPPSLRRDDAWLPWVVLGVIVVALGAFAVKQYAPPFPRSDAWQAVFLTNGQTYFGHIVRSRARALVLRDVYYLSTQAVETEVGREGSVGTSTTLVKLGNELHGPTDEMRINTAHVLFTETLRDDATVVRAIAAARERAEGSGASAVPEPSAEGTAPEGAPTTP